MSNLNFTVTAVGPADFEDQAGYLRVIRTENAQITRVNDAQQARIDEINADRALQDPPLEPLPFSPLPLLDETLAAYESLLAISVAGVHSANVQRAVDAEVSLVRQRYVDADAVTRDQVKTTLQVETDERER